MAIEKWFCNCGSVLGFIEDKKFLRIKRKDLFVEIEGGRVSRNCVMCGKINVLMDGNFKQEASEAQEKDITT